MHARKIILVAVDLTDYSGKVIDEALQTARAFEGEIILAHVVHELKSLFGVYVTDKPVGSLQESIHREGKKKLAGLAREFLEETRVSHRTVILLGTPWTEIVSCAVENHADLIVIGRHMADRPVHKILGSTAERILRNAPCSVLVVSPRKTRIEP